MTTFVLILTLATANDGLTITNIPNFTTLEECNEAGAVYRSSIPANYRFQFKPSVIVTCIQQTNGDNNV